MKRTDVTYAQLDKALRALGFSCRHSDNQPPTRVYEHPKSGALIFVPDVPESEQVMEHHLVTARVMLDEYGIADPIAFDAKLKKAG